MEQLPEPYQTHSEAFHAAIPPLPAYHFFGPGDVFEMTHSGKNDLNTGREREVTFHEGDIGIVIELLGFPLNSNGSHLTYLVEDLHGRKGYVRSSGMKLTDYESLETVVRKIKLEINDEGQD